MMRRTVRVAAPLVVVALFGACSDESDSTAGASPGAACEAYLALTAAFGGSGPVDFEGVVQPNIDLLDEHRPDAIGESVDVMLAAASGARSGDTSAFETDRFATAKGEVDRYMFAECEATARLEVVATDFAYGGVEERVEAGRIAIRLTNASTAGEVHEAVVIRRNDDVDTSFASLLALEEADAMASVTVAGSVFAPPRQEAGIAFLDLTAGSYALVCFVPQGASEADPEGSGPPHHVLGMIAEFEVR